MTGCDVKKHLEYKNHAVGVDDKTYNVVNHGEVYF